MAATMRRDSPWLALILLTAISTVGFIDRIVHRRDLRSTIAQLINYVTP